MKVPGSKMTLGQRILGSNHKNTYKNIKRIFFFRTTWLRCFKFGMLHFLEIFYPVDFYQVCSNGGPGVKNGPLALGIEFIHEIYLKIFFFRTAWLRCLKYGM